jgi:hypothetical protein
VVCNYNLILYDGVLILILFNFFAALIISAVDPPGIPTNVIPFELLSASSELVSGEPSKLSFKIHDG